MLSHLQYAIGGRRARKVTISVRQSCMFPALLSILTVLLTFYCTRGTRVRFMVQAALWGQLWELCEEPVTVFEETILVDCVKAIPVLIGPAVVFLCKGKAKQSKASV